MTKAVHKGGQILLAAMLLLASICLCTASFALPQGADNPHAHHGMDMADVADMVAVPAPQPCESDDTPCHVTAEADKAKPGPAILGPQFVVVIAAKAIGLTHVARVPAPRTLNWARPPPNPIASMDRSLT